MPEQLLDRIRREGAHRAQGTSARGVWRKLRHLEAALAALEARGAPGAQPTRKPQRRHAPARAPRGEYTTKLLTAVADRPGATAAQLAQVTGISRTTVASTLAKLVADGRLERVPLPARGVGFKQVTGSTASDTEAAQAGTPTQDRPGRPASSSDGRQVGDAAMTGVTDLTADLL